MNYGAELLLLLVGLMLTHWHHLNVARSESAASVPLMLLAAWLRAPNTLLLSRHRTHIVCSPRILGTSCGALSWATRACTDHILHLSISQTLSCCIQLVRNATIWIIKLLVVLVLRRSMLSKTIEAFSIIMLNGHIHAILHVKLILIL